MWPSDGVEGHREWSQRCWFNDPNVVDRLLGVRKSVRDQLRLVGMSGGEIWQ